MLDSYTDVRTLMSNNTLTGIIFFIITDLDHLVSGVDVVVIFLSRL